MSSSLKPSTMLAAVGVAVAAVMVVVWVERKGRERKERERKELCVPEDCPTLEKAVERAKSGDITTIRLAKGIHEVEGDEVNITGGLPITIVGAGKNETIIQGGVFLISGGDVNSTDEWCVQQGRSASPNGGRRDGRMWVERYGCDGRCSCGLYERHRVPM